MIEVIYQKSSPCPFSGTLVKKIVDASARSEKKISGRVEITMVSDRLIRRLNKEYRGKDKVTDVLSFSWREGKLAPSDILGELYISYAQIKRQAVEFSCPAKEEFARMLVHGLLHLVGYDHVAPQEAKKMFSKQEKIVARVV